MNEDYSFLQGGGEMGQLTRHYDWSLTPIGSPETWPQSLRTIVAMLLNSKFPMFLWWGEDMIQFYNDAYRPSFGNNGKHPMALGQKAVDCWPEIWPIIYPLIDQVRSTGESTWSEDQLVPIYRNGKIEDVYWTFSYGPVIGEMGMVDGVLVVCNETTDKVMSIQRLIASQERFQNLVEEATVGIVILMGDDLVVDIVNQAYGNLIGRNYRDLIGKPLFAIIPETEAHFRPIIDSVRKSGQPLYLYDHPQYSLSGGKKRTGFLNLVYQPYKETDGRITGVMVLCHDVTEQVITRRKAEASDKRFRDLVSQSTVATAVLTGKDMVVELANDTMLNTWDVDRSVIGKPLIEFLPELAGQPFPKLLDAVFTTGEMYSEDDALVYTKRKGSLEARYMNFTYKPLEDEQGKPRSILVMATDVTERALSRQRLALSERNLRNTIAKAPVAMCIFKGPEHIVEIANERMIELWGRPALDVMDKPLFEGLPEARNQGFEQLLDGVYNTGETSVAQGVPVNLPRNQKIEQIFVNFVYEAYRENDGSITGVIAVATDVTHQVISRRKIEELVGERTRLLAEANKSLQKSNEELAQFAYIASHDLQEPIRKVSIFTQMLERSLGTISNQSKTYLDKIGASSQRMLALIRDVLAYSELSEKTQEFELVSLQKTVEDALTDLELQISQKGATLSCEELPSIEAIPLQMSQLFGNLLSNALKFTRPGVAPVIHITARRLSEQEATRLKLSDIGSLYDIEVRDNGIGFEQTHSDQIFSIFQRLHGKTEYQGTGIGLAICKKIALGHRGDIYAMGEPGKGATFHVILPARP
ncbi:MAG TPA: PAS domain-containing protein [Puia sp.]